MSSKKNIADLEAASDAACEARDKAAADLDKVNALIAALILAEDHACDPSLPLAARRIIAPTDWTMITSLKDVAVKLSSEVDRLSDIWDAACIALNSADESEAA